MKLTSFLLCIPALLISSLTTAQYYNSGQDPGSLKWMQVKTDRFTVIYPKSAGQTGLDFAKSLDKAYSQLTALYPEKKFRFPVILHSYTTESNGYVALAPKRMEIYPTPEQDALPLDPYRQLAIHELTHVLQMESLNTGFTKAMSVITGEQFPGFIASLVPIWFLEGDAVFSESLLTSSGRGRSASFHKMLKAISVEKGGMYNYDKIVNGSFRDYVPDYYHSGFQMIAWSYARYNTSLWKNALSYTARLPFTINPVNLSLRKDAALTKKKLFNETFDTLQAIWASEISRSHTESFEILNPPKGKEYINYCSPVPAGENGIIAVKTSLSEPVSFVLINPSEKTERRIHVPGNINPYVISYGNGMIVWVETVPDPRWENRSWSVIKVMDIKSGRTKPLSSKTRYMSAAISPDGKYIAATENSVDNRNRLVILDAQNGKKLSEPAVPGNAYLQKPQWDDTGSKLTVISLTEDGEGIMAYDLSQQTFRVLIKAGSNDIQSAFLRNDSLFLVCSFSGTENAYLLEADSTVSPLTGSRFGATDLFVRGNQLLFSDYSSSGNNICIKQIPEDIRGKETDYDQESFLINRFSIDKSLPEDVSGNNFTPVAYRKWQHLFRFHSWMPFYSDLDEISSDPITVGPGATIMTQNNLSSLISTLGYEYADNRNKLHASVKWRGWYPLFEARIDFGDSQVIQKLREPVADPADIRPGNKITGAVSLPLLFQHGRFSQYLFLSASSVFHNNYIYMKERGTYDHSQIQTTGRIYFTNYYRYGIRDINPKWAQTVDIIHSVYPFDRDLYGDLTTLRSSFCFPGIFKDDGIKIHLETEKQSTEVFILANRISVPRSYEDIISKKADFFSVDYYFPVIYPDFNIASFLYLKRVRADLFYDFSKTIGSYVYSTSSQGTDIEYHDYSESFRSFGIELMSDFHVLRVPYIVSAGVQAAWREFGEMPYLKLLLSVDLYGMTIGKYRQ